jgi:hypothetical protein
VLLGNQVGWVSLYLLQPLFYSASLFRGGVGPSLELDFLLESTALSISPSTGQLGDCCSPDRIHTMGD